MPSAYKVTEASNTYFITTSTQQWIPILFNDTIFQIITDSLKYCQAKKGLKIHGYVIMPNHFHAIISHAEPDQISGVIRDFKRHTSTEIKNYLSNLGEFSQLFWIRIFHNKEAGHNRLWQRGYHPIAITSPRFFEQKLNYIHFNPVKKGFVEQPEYWKYSSARNYLLGDERLITMDRLG